MIITKSVTTVDLLSEMGILPVSETNITDKEIQNIEKKLNINFPSFYQTLLKRFGTIIHKDFIIFGLGVPNYLLPSVVCAVSTARAIEPNFPSKLIPIQSIENGIFACIYDTKEEDSKVVLWFTGRTIADQEFPILANSLNNYIVQLASKSTWREKGMENLKNHVNKFQKAHQYEHASGGDLPKNNEWRPYRYCIQNVLFGATVVRHSREQNRLEVDVFLTANVPEYGALAGAKALTAFLLSEAYKCGGSLEIQFTRNVENGQIPDELQKLASTYGIIFNNCKLGNISSQESKILYGAITEYSTEFMRKIELLEKVGKINLARACYVVHHGIWTKEQVEMIVLGSNAPDRILGGFSQPFQRLLYYNDILHARAALLGGALDRFLITRERDIPYEIEDDLQNILIQFDGNYYAKSYQSDNEVYIPWIFREEGTRFIQPEQIFSVFVRARDSYDLLLYLQNDLKQAAEYRDKYHHPTFLLVPADFASLNKSFLDEVYENSKVSQIGILVNPDPLFLFNSEAAKKLAQSRILRQ